MNASRCPIHSYHRDGAMRIDGNYGSTKGYEPNSFGVWQEQKHQQEPALNIGSVADHWNFREDDDDYFTQPRKLFNLMNDEQKKVLFENTARAISGAQKFIQVRHIRNCYHIDPAYAKGIADALGLTMEEVLKYEHPALELGPIAHKEMKCPFGH